MPFNKDVMQQRNRTTVDQVRDMNQVRNLLLTILNRLDILEYNNDVHINGHIRGASIVDEFKERVAHAGRILMGGTEDTDEL